jgi:hypothetical protein
MEPIVRAIVIVWFGIYLGIAGWGWSNVREGLEPSNLLVSDSYAIAHYQWMEQYFWRYGSEVQIVVNNAADLTLDRERRKTSDMVKVS